MNKIVVAIVAIAVVAVGVWAITSAGDDDAPTLQVLAERPVGRFDSGS